MKIKKKETKKIPKGSFISFICLLGNQTNSWQTERCCYNKKKKNLTAWVNVMIFAVLLLLGLNSYDQH
jgi:hypothetical protein